MLKIKQSTKDFFAMHGMKNVLHFLHGYAYLAWTEKYIYLGLNIGVKYLPKPVTEAFLGWIVPRYHAKVVQHADARKILTLDIDVALDAELSKKIIPFDIANKVILNSPGNITVMNCACRHVNKNACSSPKVGTQVCFLIGEPQASFVLEHAKALNPRKVTSEEALEIIQEAHNCGWVHHVWLKDAVGGATYAMCNCCKCCCGATFAMRMLNNKTFKIKNNVKPVLSSGYTIQRDNERCVGCGVCVQTCPYAAVALDPAMQKAVITYTECMGCGVCVDKCPHQAIVLARDEAKGIPLDMNALL